MKRIFSILLINYIFLFTTFAQQTKVEGDVFSTYYNKKGILQNCNDCLLDIKLGPTLGTHKNGKFNYFQNTKIGGVIVAIRGMEFPKNNNKYQVFFDEKCISTTGGVKLSKITTSDSKKNGFIPKALSFEVSENGESYIEIKYAVSHINNVENLSHCYRYNHKLKFYFTAVGLKEPPKPSPVISYSKPSVSKCEYIKSFDRWGELCGELNGECRDYAITRMMQLDDLLWRKYRKCNSYHKYIKLEERCGNYKLKNLEKAKAAKDKCDIEDEIKRLWGKAQEIGTTQLIEEFLEKYPNSQYEDEARLELVKLLSMKLQFSDESTDDCRVITVSNVSQIQIKNISLDNGATYEVLDEEELPFSKKVKICIKEGGNFKFVFFDPEWNKTDTFSLNELLITSFNQLGQEYQFKVRQGKSPYQIEWFDLNTDKSVYKLKLSKNHYKINKDSLLGKINNKIVNYENQLDTIFVGARAYSKGSHTSFEFKKFKLIVPIQKAKKLDVLLIIAGGLLLFSIFGGIIYFYINRSV